MHLFLYGPSGAGKSTLIRQALQARGLTPPGLKTVKLPLTGGRQAEPADRINANQSHPAEWAGATDLVFLTSAGYRGTHQELGPESLIGYCGKRGILAARPEVFESLGTGLLADIPAGSLVLLDELGFLENDAPRFQAAVTRLLDGPYRVIGVIKERSSPFLDRIKAHPLVRCLKVTADNRREAAGMIGQFLDGPGLDQALGLEYPPRSFPSRPDTGPAAKRPGGRIISLVGGGGKTSAMYILANELAAKGAKVIVTTTTHIRPPKPPFVKGALSLPRQTGAASSQDIDRLLAEIRDALGSASPLGLTGGPVNGKSGPVDKALVRRLPEIADFIIAEADGSRGLPIKAPAAHEPVIPPASALVVAVAGLSALGRPLDEVCHRPELAAALLGCSPSKTVSAEDCLRLLLSPEGGAKGLPRGASFSLLLNQADAADISFRELEQAAAAAIAGLPGAVVPERLLYCALQSGRPPRRLAPPR